jgi:hypothetical protein
MFEAGVKQTIEDSIIQLLYFFAIVALKQLDYFQQIIILVLALLMQLAIHDLTLNQKANLCCLWLLLL